jgi:glycogenin glucosyltransferase
MCAKGSTLFWRYLRKVNGSWKKLLLALAEKKVKIFYLLPPHFEFVVNLESVCSRKDHSSFIIVRNSIRTFTIASMTSQTFRPVRPNAVATLITTDDFLPGAQTLLYSLKNNLPSVDSFGPDDYPPELIVLITPNISESVRQALYPAFCTRLVEVDPIEIPDISKNAKNNEGGAGAGAEEAATNANESHVASWSDKCGYTKLHIFRQTVYDKVLYIDSDCLVVKDLSHLFKLHHDSPRGRLLAACPDIFPPDKFNAGVMLISPSDALFEDLIAKTQSLITYDGGDTGYLNAYFNDWHSYPAEGRLGFQYNAQRFMHQCTYEKQPKYWDVAVGEISIIHYSSSPKPWQGSDVTKPLSQSQLLDSNFLTEEEAQNVAKAESKSKVLDKLWHKNYKKSFQFKEEFQEEQTLKLKQKVILRKPKPAASQPSKNSTKQKKTSLTFNKRYKALRKEGMDAKSAMKKARIEFGMDKDDQKSAGKQVAAMFGMPM